MRRVLEVLSLLLLLPMAAVVFWYSYWGCYWLVGELAGPSLGLVFIASPLSLAVGIYLAYRALILLARFRQWLINQIIPASGG